MMDGKIRQVGTVSEIFNRPVDKDVADFVGVENVLEGVVKGDEDGIKIIDAGFLEVCCVLEVFGRVNIFIRPEDIIISKESGKTSARNNVLSTVSRVMNLGPISRIELDCGLVAFTTKQSVEDLEIAQGDEVYASFKATAVHVVEG